MKTEGKEPWKVKEKKCNYKSRSFTRIITACILEMLDSLSLYSRTDKLNRKNVIKANSLTDQFSTSTHPPTS